MTDKSPRDGTRTALATAIAERETCQRNLDDANAAVSKSWDAYSTAMRRVEKLTGELEEATSAPPSDDVIAGLAGGADVMELQRPATELKAELAAAEEQADAWKNAIRLAEQAVPLRQKALDAAERHVDSAAREVVASSIDVSKLIADTEALQQQVLARRIFVWSIHDTLPQGGEERTALANALGRAFLTPELSHAHHPSGEGIRLAFKRLHEDPDTPLPTGST